MFTHADHKPGPAIMSLYDGFFLGGARIAHTEMVTHLQEGTSQRHTVVSLTDRVVREGVLQRAYDTIPYQRLQASGVPTVALPRESSTPMSPTDMLHVEKQLIGADIIVSLKEQPLPVLRELGTYGKPLVVSLHRSDPETQGDGVQVLVDLDKQGLLSRAICCAQSTKEAYAALGISEEKLVIVPNGVDLDRFHSDPQIRLEQRRILGISPRVPVVLIAARFDDMKNIPLFVDAAAAMLKERPETHFLMAGAGMTMDNAPFRELIEERVPKNKAYHFHGLGIQSDMNALYNAADITSLTSNSGEAAPLCLLEAMAAGSIPLTTSQGDSALMVGDERLVTGYVGNGVAASWLAALDDRDEHKNRFLEERESLSDQRVFSGFTEVFEHLI